MGASQAVFEFCWLRSGWLRLLFRSSVKTRRAREAGLARGELNPRAWQRLVDSWPGEAFFPIGLEGQDNGRTEALFARARLLQQG
jgi:hypothetical protein